MSTTADAADAQTPGADNNNESSRVRDIAVAHGLDAEGFAELIAESRSRSRRNRRRVPDARLDELVRNIGARR